ncbi:MAG: PD40 domain-containing protein [Acidobacteria bacterium]|nr:PD40 domain-containing protein [Acidobacteriota bacterium]
MNLQPNPTPGIFLFDPDSGKQERLGDDRVPFVSEISWLPDGSGLVFPGNQLGAAAQLWLISYPEGRVRRLTNDQSEYANLSVSKDAKSLAAIRRSSTANVWVVPATGAGKLRQITRDAGANGAIGLFDIWRDGTIVFVARGGDSPALFRVGADGGNRQLLSAGSGAVFAPRFLTDAVFYMQFGDDRVPHIWRAGSGDERSKRLTDGAGEDLKSVSPDGRTILFSRFGQPGQLWSMPAEGGEPIRMAEDLDGAVSYSPDGKLVWYGASRKIGGLYRAVSVILPAAGGQPVARLDLLPGANKVDWAPDSKALTFVRGVGAAEDVYRQPIAGGDPVPITHFKEGRIAGTGIGRTSRLAILRELEGIRNLWASPAGGGEPVQVTDFKTGVIFYAAWGPDAKDLFFTYGEAIEDVVLIRDFR